jgi:hypothetical protein
VLPGKLVKADTHRAAGHGEKYSGVLQLSWTACPVSSVTAMKTMQVTAIKFDCDVHAEASFKPAQPGGGASSAEVDQSLDARGQAVAARVAE